MLVSLEWLRSLCPVDENAARIAQALTSRGLTVDALATAGEDHVLDIDVPANRPDCLGHLGLAREISAAFGVELSPSPVAPAGTGDPVEKTVRVEIDDADLCSRFTARLVRGVRLGPSPAWVARRLETCGMRPINNVVDASNLVLLEVGNPIHFYDHARVSGGLLEVRRAGPGEWLRTLDGMSRTLDAEMLVIADDQRAVGLAGLMGGADTEIGETTRDVLIEAAWFEPRSVRSTARRLGLHTEASHRFERGVDVEGVLTAQALAAGLLEQLAGGRTAPGLLDVHPSPREERRLVLRPGQLHRLLGYQPDAAAVGQALTALRLSPTRLDEQRYQVVVPSWRVDLEREADLVEEVSRHLGYDEIPVKAADLPPVVEERGGTELEEAARDRLAHLGFHEAVGYAMIGAGEDEPFLVQPQSEAIKLTRPITESLACLRRSLLPGLLSAVDLNIRRGVRNVRLFEIGRVFVPTGPGRFPDEPLHAGLAWCGAGGPRHWGAEDREVDLYDLAGAVEQLLRSLRPGATIERTVVELPGFHPGHSVQWRVDSASPAAWAGGLHPELREELNQDLFLAEIDLEALMRVESRGTRYSSVPRLNSVTRDLALVMTRETSYAEVLQTLRSVEPPAPAEFQAIDRYEGPPLEEGQSSLTVRVTLQPSERSLTESEIEEFRLGLVAELRRQLSLTIRS
jgi:phenylalanyl-tRNA synthetase beta chain